MTVDSDLCAAKEDTKIHIEAANEKNSITKAEAREALQRVAYSLRNKYGIGSERAGHDVVLAVSAGNPFIPILFYGILAAGGVYSGASTAFTVRLSSVQYPRCGKPVLTLSSLHGRWASW